VDFDTEFVTKNALVHFQPTELERQSTWDNHANELIERYAGFSDAANLTDAEKVVALVSLVPMALNVVTEARDTIERLNDAQEASSALLVEALARLEALDMLPGDPGGPFYCKDADDLAMAMRWIGPMHSDPPDWERDDDPLEAAWDWDKNPVMWQSVRDRADELLKRIRQEMFNYYGRVAKVNPERAAKWRPWWRTAKKR
jgi:hypothetical protein